MFQDIHANNFTYSTPLCSLTSQCTNDILYIRILSDREKTSVVINVIDGNPGMIHHQLVRLIKLGEIIKVKRGVYTLLIRKTFDVL